MNFHFKQKVKKATVLSALLLAGFAQARNVSSETLDIQYLSPTVHYESHTQGYTGFADISRMYIDGKLGWCIEPETPAHAGAGYSSTPSYNHKMNLITAMASDLGAETNNEIFVGALKMLHGEINWTWDKLTGMTMATADSAIGRINTKITEWNTKPSFDGQTITVKYGDSITLTDTNNVLSEYSNMKVNSANVIYSISGNKITITPKDATKASGILGFQRPKRYGSPLVWDKPSSQKIITQGDPFSLPFNINIKVTLQGDAEILKLDKVTRKPVAGVSYKVDFSDGTPSRTVTTGKIPCFIAGFRLE
ncbi:hypothetical protein SAMN02745116_01344 [Pilibacter termitis]|uniref:Uncharacterized protein n=1 Tax=Pilibacter termitis TaxID=263852 RepID=A0A1T4N8F8_9ENTE|nr:hypothetical protein [Pilibacter termitis]SJZ75491.1 hypothetical protein SAMN02745116_01344 [Pilibacter termitis]